MLLSITDGSCGLAAEAYGSPGNDPVGPVKKYIPVFQEKYPMKKSSILMLIASAILVTALVTAGCTQDSGSSSAQSSGNPTSTAVQDQSGSTSSPFAGQPVKSGNGPQVNQSVPSGTPPGDSMMNGTAPFGTPPGGAMMNGTPPSGTPPSGTPPSGTPPSGS